MPVADLQLAARENAEVRARVKRLFWWALAARLAVALFIHYAVANDEMFAPDQKAYHEGGQLLAGHWAGEIPAPPDSLLPAGRKGYYYVVGFLYFLFGPNSLIPKLVNCLVGALIVHTEFDLALRIPRHYSCWWPPCSPSFSSGTTSSSRSPGP